MNNKTSNYRYNKVTMGIMMNDFAFDKTAPKPGDIFPEFSVASLSGNMISKNSFVGKRPMLMVFGSMTCPMTISAFEPLTRLHNKYGDKVEFVMLNVREAHPAENAAQPTTLQQKKTNAQMLANRFNPPWTIAVDDLDGTLHQALDVKPNAAYLMDASGKIVFRALWGNDESALNQALCDLVSDHPLKKIESTSTFGPLTRGLGYFHETLLAAGPQATRDMLLAVPPAALVGLISGTLFRWLRPTSRGKATILSLVLLIASAVYISNG